MDSLSNLKKNKVYAPVITGVAILVAILLASPMYSQYQESVSQHESVEADRDTKQLKLDKLRAQAAKLKDEASPLAQSVAKISKDFNNSEIIEAVMINPFTAPSSGALQRSPTISIENISLNKGNKEPSGIYRGTITMTIKGTSAEIIMTYLDYLTKNTKYYFALNSINLPVDTNTTAAAVAGQVAPKEVSVPVTLGLYYYP